MSRTLPRCPSLVSNLVLAIGLLGFTIELQAAVLGPELVERLERRPNDAAIPVLLTLRDQADLSRIRPGRTSAELVIRMLRAVADGSQVDLAHFLDAHGIAFRAFWITNCIAVQATPPLLAELSGRPDLSRIDLDVPVGLPRLDPAPEETRATYWNMDKIRAPEVWNTLHLDGTGIVIGSMDTGMDIAHPALAGKWRGGTNSWLDLVNGLPDPYDDHGHGTHTIGTLVGGDGPGPFTEDIGLAWNSRVISAKVLDADNSFSSASIVIAGAEWMLDPDGEPSTDDFPHVINNSWYFFSQTYTGFYAAANAWRAAGIVPVFCLGNEGPAPGSTRPPASYNNVMGIGATTSSDLVWVYSSRGPSPAGPAFPDDLRKPDLSAPGALVRSSIPGGGYQSWSGTSMATPHVAATAALLLQSDPTLTFDEIRDALLTSAVDLGAPGYDYDFGYGRLDAYAALAGLSAGIDSPGPGAIARRGSIARPNPFTDQVELDFATTRGSLGLPVEILDASGRRIRTLHLTAPTRVVAWDGRDDAGHEVPSGVYHTSRDGGRFIRIR